jgi:hypothetical protein
MVQNKRPGVRITNENFIHGKIKSRQNLGNTCYHSVQNILSPCPLCKNVKIEI